MEVVVPPKRNKFEKSFGFARFQEVGDERVFAVKLDNVLIDGRKIHVNLPRFERKSGISADRGGKGESFRGPMFKGVGERRGEAYRNNVSYAEVVTILWTLWIFPY